MRRLVWILPGVLVIAVLAFVLSTQLGGDDADPSSKPSAPVPTTASRTAPVPAPSGGSTKETVAPGRPVKTIDAGASKKVTHADGVTVRVDDVRMVEIKGVGPGQLSGPAVAVELTISNGSKKRIDPSSAVVTVLQGKAGRVLTPTTADPARIFPRSLEPGGSSQGTYVFELPEGKLRPADVVVQYQTGRGVARFHL